MRTKVAAGSLAFLLAACGPGGSPSSAPSATSGPSSALPSPASPSPMPISKPSPTATAVVENPAPAELAGAWRTTEGERIVLSLIADRYSISRGPGSARGRIAVRGSEIELFGSDLCAGSGVYRWMIAAEILTLTAVGAPDPCSNRRDAVADRPFTRS